MAKERDHFVDFLKGIMIFLVLLGHSIQALTTTEAYYDNALFKVIYSFHMPLFGFLSGYVSFWSYRKNLNAIVKSRMQGILLPMTVWACIGMLIALVKKDVIGISALDVLKTFYYAFFGIWFLWTILLTSLLLAIVYKVSEQRKWLFVAMLMVGVLLLGLLPGYTSTWYILPYFMFGFYFSKHQLGKSKHWNMICLLSAIPWMLMICFFDREHYIYTTGIDYLIRSGEGGIIQQLQIDLYRYIIGVVGIIAAWGICERIYRWIKKTRCADFLCAVGKNTMQIYLIQRIILEDYLTSIFRGGTTSIFHFLNENTVSLNLLSTVLAFLLLCIIHKMAEIIKKSQTVNRILFGGR